MSRRKKPIKSDQSKVRVWKEPLTGSSVSLQSNVADDNKSSRLVRRPIVLRENAQIEVDDTDIKEVNPFENPRSDTAFSKILEKQQSAVETKIVDKYDEQFIKQPKQSRSIFAFITDDIIWKATALGCILGAFLFYFNTFQPLMLSKYIDAAQENINAMVLDTNTQFANTATSLSELQTSSAYNPTQLCTQSPDYTTSAQDIQSIDALLATLVPAKNYQNIPTAYIYYDEAIDNMYSKVYTAYEESFESAQARLIEYKGIPRWLDFKNDWLQICKTLVSNQGAEDVEEYCDEMNGINSGYANSLKPKFWSEFEPFIDDLNNLCSKNANLKDTTQWELDWLASFSKMMSYSFENTSLVDSLQQAALSVQQQSKDTTIEMNKYYNMRTSFVNIWYFLSIRTN